MQTKQEILAKMYESTATKATSSLANWTGLLSTIGKLYKYPFHEQLMIHEQRPDAVACAEYSLWNDTMNRYVRRGAKGIALIDPFDDNPTIKYVFDVSDTGGREQSRRPFLWEMQEQYEEPIKEMLQNKFQAEGENLVEQFDNIAKNLAIDYYKDHKRDISYLVENSYLEELDEDNIAVAFLNATTVSIAYTLMQRCGIDTKQYFEHEDFLPIFDFNTATIATFLGTAVSEQTEQVFREISKTILKTERSLQNERNQLHQEWGLSNTQHSNDRATQNNIGQVRENEESTSNGTPQAPIQSSSTIRETATAPIGNRPNSQSQIGADNDRVAEETQSTGQNDTADGMGSVYEQPASTGGGNHLDGTDLQLNIVTGEQLTLFPTAEQQIKNIADRQERVKTQSQSAISISQAEIEHELKGGTGFVDGKLRVYGFYQKDLSPSEMVKKLKDEYGHGGHSHTYLDGSRGFVDHEPSKGIIFKKYDDDKKVTISWINVEKHIRALIATESYLTSEEKAQYDEQQLATVGIETTSISVPVTEQTELFTNEPPANPSTQPSQDKINATLYPAPIWWKDYSKIKNENSDKIVLHQLGDFFEAFQDDAKVMSEELDLSLTSREVRGIGKVPMVGIPAHRLEQYTQQLLDNGHEIALVSVENEKRQVHHITSVKAQEQKQATEVEGILTDTEVAELRERLENTANEDTPFVRQVIADVERINAQEQAQDTQATSKDTQAVTTQDNITLALCEWNGNENSRANVIQYMQAHGRERGTAKWLQNEFGGNLPNFIVTSGNESQEIPWAKVQRLIGQLVAENKFFVTEATQRYTVEQTSDAFDEPYVVRDNLVTEDTLDRYYEVEEHIQTFENEKEAQNLADSLNEVEPPQTELTYEMYDTENTNVLRLRANSYLVGVEVQTSPTLWERLAEKGLTPNENSEERVVFETDGDTWHRFMIPDTYGNKWNSIEALDVLTQKEIESMWEVVQKVIPTEEMEMELLSIPYNKGDTVYLEDGTAFLIEDITDHDVKLRDPSLYYPIIRAESKENFLRLLEYYPQEQQTVQEVLQAEETVTHISTAENYRITDMKLGIGTKQEKIQNNLTAIKLLKDIELQNREATEEEQAQLVKYVGFGGLQEIFEEDNANYQMLKHLLDEGEYSDARASVLNAHYTSPTIIKAIYDTVEKMGFTTGNILEPSCGTGHFFGMLPQTMKNSNLYGVELDSITGRIAKKLYPNANIAIKGFEKTDFSDSFFDVAIGNVPFGNYSLNEKRYAGNGFKVHDHFFAKALDKVRPGGVVAFVTSKGTLDKENPQVRKYLAGRAELLGAIRLPNNAFKANAGTEVTSDIIFLQKRENPIDIQPDWVHLGFTENDVPVNSYFAENPEMILGEMVMKTGQFGMESACIPIEGADLAEQLSVATQNILGEIAEVEMPDMDISANSSIPADPNVKNYSYTVQKGEVYYRENSLMVKPEANATALERIKGMVAIRECVNELIHYQLEEYPDEDIKKAQGKLNRLYDDFTDKYGLLNGRGNALAFNGDNSYYLLCSLEDIDEEGNLKAKADMFYKRTIKPTVKITSVDTPSEALAVSLSEKAKIDMDFMAQLTGLEEQEIYDKLKGVIFLNPMYGYGNTSEEKYVTADEYLSGNVREKLVWAKRSAEQFKDDYTVNVEALEQAQPTDLDASEIEVRLGATWIDKDYIQDFMYETFQTPYRNRGSYGIEVKFATFTSEWSIKNKNQTGYSDVTANTTFGTSRANAYRILEDTLNLRDIRIYDTIEDADGKEKRVLNKNETTLAQQKQQLIKDKFREWIWDDPQRRQTLVKLYNEKFNSTRPREYDGRHITFGGINPEITLREHQINAIAHILYGNNVLLAHEVGAGKSFEMIAGAMESKRLGLCTKPLIAVPNHLTEQMASEFLRLYPAANILVATRKDFETKNRKKFCARIATGDYDAVIIGHSQFERIPVSLERQERLLEEQIDEIVNGISEVKASGGERFTIKQLERTKKGLEQRLEKLQALERKDNVITFEQLGVDKLIVDEAHSYKNGFIFTKMRNVAGLGSTESQKSADMFMKCRYLDEITGGKGVIFATGTPISNSMVEMYVMQRYLQYHSLQEKGLLHFDSWASTFGETQTTLEINPQGSGYRARTRFSKFFNLPELMNMFKEVADIKTADQLDLPTPKIIYETVAVKPTEIQQEIVQELSKRAARVHANLVDPSEDNMLTITNDGRKLGLDQRTFNPLLPDDPNSKVNTCISNIYRIWSDTKEQRLTQLLFCDLSTPKAKPKDILKVAKAENMGVNGAEVNALQYGIEVEEDAVVIEKETPFSVYHDIKEKLTLLGVPEQEIAFIHDAKSEVQKKDLFAKVRNGDVRLLLGSTSKCGAGMNVQDRLIALHDLDAPWRPGDLRQRSGRIERQGNMNEEAEIYRYVTESTFDAYLWQTLENKQKFISQIMTSKSPVRSCDDLDESALSYAEIKALCAGNPKIKQKMDLDIEVAKLKLLKASHQSTKFKLEDQLLKHFPENIKLNEGYIKGFEQDLVTLNANTPKADEFMPMIIKGDTLVDKDNAGAAILAAIKEVKGKDPVEIGTYRGFTMHLSYDGFYNEHKLTLKGAMSHIATLGSDLRGNLTRIDNALNVMPNRLEAVKAQLENLLNQKQSAEIEKDKPFPQEEELKVKSKLLAELDAELNLGGNESHEESLAEPTMIPKSSRPSVLDSLKQNQQKTVSTPKKSKTEREER